MVADRNYDWAAAAAAQLLNLGHIDTGESKALQFHKVADVVYQAIKMAEREAREEMLRPSTN